MAVLLAAVVAVAAVPAAALLAVAQHLEVVPVRALSVARLLAATTWQPRGRLLAAALLAVAQHLVEVLPVRALSAAVVAVAAALLLLLLSRQSFSVAMARSTP